MKYIFTLIILVFSLSVYSQVPRQKVIVEVGTGTWCSACPAVVEIIHDLEEEDANIAVVEYHKGDAYQNTDGLMRKSYYDFPWYPTTYYDSNHIGYDDWATYSVHHDYYTTQNDLLSSFTLAIDGDIDGTSVSGTVTAGKVAAYDGDNLVLHVVLTESDIPENWQGETELDYVARAMFPNGNGTAIDFTEDSNLTVDFNFTLDDSWVVNNCSIVYFIQNNDTKEIVQGDEVVLNTISTTDYTQESFSYTYPNPVKDILKIISEDNSNITNIEIVDAKGSLVFQQNNHTENIAVGHLQKGVYILTYTENEIVITTKFIKE